MGSGEWEVRRSGGKRAGSGASGGEGGDREGDGAVGGGEFDGVAEEVGEGLGDRVGGCPDLQGDDFCFQGDAFNQSTGAHCFYGVLN